MRTIHTKAQKPQQNSGFNPSSAVSRYIKPLKGLGYIVTQQLGHGSEGVVFLAVNQHSGQEVAIKACDLKKCPKNAIGEFWLWAYVDHPNCLKIQEKFTFKTTVYYVMQYTPNLTVLDWIQEAWYADANVNESNKPNEEMVKKWCRQLICGVQYLHDKGFYHLDIKPDNVFLDDNWDVKLGDFGFMRTISDMSEPLILGCPAYMPPEGLVSEPSLGMDLAKVDIWSTGVTIFEMITGKLLSGKNFKICGQKRSLLLQNLRENHPKAITMSTLYPGGHDLVQHMTQWESSNRVNATEALQHPWLRLAYGGANLRPYGGDVDEENPGVIKSIIGGPRTAITTFIKNPATKFAANFYSLFNAPPKAKKSIEIVHSARKKSIAKPREKPKRKPIQKAVTRPTVKKTATQPTVNKVVKKRKLTEPPVQQTSVTLNDLNTTTTRNGPQQNEIENSKKEKPALEKKTN